MKIRNVSAAVGLVQGLYRDELFVCQYSEMVNARGCMWYGGDTLAFSVPLVLLQLVIIFFVTTLTFSLLRPLKQSLVSAQLIAGILLGKSGLGRIRSYWTLFFRLEGRIVLQTVSDLGFMFHLFILAVQVDVTIVKRAGKRAMLIGASCFFLPFALGGLASYTLPQFSVVDTETAHFLPFVAVINSASPFPVITSLLSDLKILNSEIGRIATLASLVNDICVYTVSMLLSALTTSASHTKWNGAMAILWIITFTAIIVFAVRPFVRHIARSIPERGSMKETQFLMVAVLVLICGFVAESIGQPAGLGTFLLGMVVQGGPPLGSSLVYKIDSLCTGLLVPAKFAISGLSMNIFAIGNGKSLLALESVIIMCYVAKFIGTLSSAVHFGVPFRDAVSLALIMCCKGVIEAALYIGLKDNGVITSEAYALLLITMLVVTGIARPLIWYLYDPSRRYLGHRTNSILHLDPTSELRIQVCIHNEDNVPSIVNLLEASNPTTRRPLTVFVLNLMELKGRGAALLVPTHNKRGESKLKSLPSRTEHIANAFNIFAHRSQGSIAVHHFTSIVPYASMYNDICSIAADKGVNIVIVPFHKQWAIDGRVGETFPAIRMVNQEVLRKAPCSVGILVDRGQLADSKKILFGHSLFRVTMLYLGGPDDDEALAYCIRMIEHPHICLTLVHLRHTGHDKEPEMIHWFKSHIMDAERVSYREVTVTDAVGTTQGLHSLKGNCDICVVGRDHDPSSDLILGITEWIECPELGFIGDMLATSDYAFSLLVVQQIPPGAEFINRHSQQAVCAPSCSGYGFGSFG